jgi:isoleucyl-tRNA synthetase
MKTRAENRSKRYNPKSLEREINSWWKENKLYEKTKAARKNGPKFYFLDGPPYVTNPIHVGTTWNKSIKDSVNRFKRMNGFNVRAQPGFDMHGLPIEVMVEKRLKIKTKREIEERITVKKFVDECRRFATANLRLLTRQFRDLGVWMDWDTPYMTLKDDYIESVWWLIKRADEKGMLKRGIKSVHWCYRCGTVLSGYEVAQEYREVEDTSVFVRFPLREGKESLLIWTTTPWTLPANVAVMVLPEANYVKALVDNEVLILAEERCKIFDEMNKTYKILDIFPGKKLKDLTYEAPLSDEVPVQRNLEDAHRVILSSEYVTMDEGTGCVHVAPGHGEEDFEVGKENMLPVLSPVDDNGRFTDEGGKYKGELVFDANKEILADLKKKELLFCLASVKHRYPHCWRCKSPLILRTTDQWFIAVSDFKNKLIEANSQINWIPKWAGEARFGKWLNEARDWVISRQRYWGSPLPIWICKACGKHVAIESKKELREKAVEKYGKLELHRPWVDQVLLKCECGGEMRRVQDVIDVWVDSGAASWACLGYPNRGEEFEKWWPADFITEGHDQTRGWFYTLLVSSLVAFDRAPYRNVLMHGFTLDENGREMHKSLGNFVSPEEIYKKYGRDTLRWFEMGYTTWEDLKFSWKGVEESYKNLQIVWNVFNFTNLYMSLDKFNPETLYIKEIKKNLRPEDTWLISKVEGLKKSVTKHMEELAVHSAVRELNTFILEDLSRWYIKLVRRRLWQEKTEPDKVAAYVTLYYALKTLLIMCAPFIPFITEKLYQVMVKTSEKRSRESVHLEDWPLVSGDLLNTELEKNMEIARGITKAVASARQIAKIKLRQPIAKITVATDDKGTRDAVEELEEIILDQSNAKYVKFLNLAEERDLKTIKAIPKYDVLGPIFRRKSANIGDAIKMTNGKEILEGFNKDGKWRLMLNGDSFDISPEAVLLKEELPLNYVSSEIPGGRVYINTLVSEELLREGLARDMVRRIQEMRKILDLPVEAFIKATITAPTRKDKGVLKEEAAYIAQEVRASNLGILFEEERPKCNIEKTYTIGGKVFTIGLIA